MADATGEASRLSGSPYNGHFPLCLLPPRCSSSTSSAISSAACSGRATSTVRMTGAPFWRRCSPLRRYRERGAEDVLPRRRGLCRARTLRDPGSRGCPVRRPSAGQPSADGADRAPVHPPCRRRRSRRCSSRAARTTPRAGASRAGWWPRSSGTGANCTRGSASSSNLRRPAERVVRFYNGRGTAEQWVKEGKVALRSTRLSCRAFGPTPSGYSCSPWRTTWPIPAHPGAAGGGRPVVADEHCARSWSRSGPGPCATPLRRVPAG